MVVHFSAFQGFVPGTFREQASKRQIAQFIC